MHHPIHFNADLNEEQLRVVTAPDGPILVLAAAGTGKTRTLVYRVASLAERGVDPTRILLLTFTNKAAREMLERAQTVAGGGVGGIWGGTFHHLANRLLRRHAARLGYTSEYPILDRDDSRQLVGECVKQRRLQDRDFPKRDVLLSLFSARANTDVPIETLAQARFEASSTDPADVIQIHEDYVRRKRQLGAMDFDDLLVNALALLREHPDLAAIYRDRFLHVLVDEYQDTNTIQAELVDRIAEGHRNLLVVGDDFQSIYSWRGADFRHIMTFPKRYPDACIHKLEVNYRSVPEVLEVANACMAGNPEQYPKVLRPTRAPHRRPRVVYLHNGEDQARYVVEQIRRLCAEGHRPSDIAVLYRAHFHAMELQLELTRQRIRHVITSGLRFFEQAHIKDALSMLRVLQNPTDELAFARLLGLLPGVGPGTTTRLWKKLDGSFQARDPDHIQRLTDGLRAPARASWEKIVRALSLAIDHHLVGRDGGDVLESFLDTFYESYAVNAFEDPDRRMEDLRELVQHTRKHATVEEFLSEVALLTNLDAEWDSDDGNDREAVRLSTVHQAKGLEWPIVIVLWATEGMFPSARALGENPDAMAEERRLFYVAVTRARDELMLCVPELRRMRDGGVFYCQPSLFIRELPDTLLHEVRLGDYR